MWILAALGALAGVANAAGTVLSTRSAVQTAAIQREQYARAARSEEVRAEQKSAEIKERLAQVLASNLAQRGSSGFAGSTSLVALGRSSVEDALRDIDIERGDAELRADALRLRAGSIHPNRMRVAGLLGTVGSLAAAGAAGYGAYAGYGSGGGGGSYTAGIRSGDGRLVGGV